MTTTNANAALTRIAQLAAEIYAKNPNGSKGGKKKTPKLCACGCGDWTKGGDWMPGHDSKALSRELARIREEEALAPKAELQAAEEPQQEPQAQPEGQPDGAEGGVPPVETPAVQGDPIGETTEAIGETAPESQDGASGDQIDPETGATVAEMEAEVPVQAKQLSRKERRALAKQ